MAAGSDEKAGLMDKGVRVFSNSKGAFPRIPNLIHKPISATLAHDQSDLLVDIFLKLLGIRAFSLFEQFLQLLINSLRWFCKDAVKP